MTMKPPSLKPLVTKRCISFPCDEVATCELTSYSRFGDAIIAQYCYEHATKAVSVALQFYSDVMSREAKQP